MGRATLRLTLDTNPLVRFIMRDDQRQALIVDRLLSDAAVIAITLPSWCEFVWVLGQTYRLPRTEILFAVEALLEIGAVVTDRPAVEAGLVAMRAGRDFADGVIAYQGRRLGGETFVSFDKKAVAFLRAQGYEAKLL